MGGGITASTNISSMVVQKELKGHSAKAQYGIAQLSSGNKLVKSSDNSAAAAIAKRMDSTIRSLDQARTNSLNAAGMIQVATGALEDIGTLLSQLQSLAARSTDGTLSSTELGYVNTEYQETLTQLDRVSSRARWNGLGLLDGGVGSATVIAAGVQAGTGIVQSTSTNGIAAGLTGGRGFITGNAESVSVNQVGAGYDVTITLDDGKRFVANTTPANAAVITFTNPQDTSSYIQLSYDAAVTGITSAETFKSELESSLAIAGGLGAQFNSLSTAVNNGLTGVTAGTNSDVGTYAISYEANSGKLRLTNGKQVWEEAVTTTGAAQTITFGNGISASLDNTFAVGTGVTQVIFDVAPVLYLVLLRRILCFFGLAE